MASILKVKALLYLKEDGSCVDKYAMSRTESKIVKTVIDKFKNAGVNAKDYTLYISHADNEESALKAKRLLQDIFDNIEVIVLGGLAQRTERVGNDRNPLFCHEKPQQTQGGVPESIKMVSPSATASAARRPMRDLSIWLRPERMGVGTAPEGTRSGHAAVYLGDVAALLKLVQVAADGILGHAKNLAQLVNADGLARDDILLYRIETADFHIHSSHILIYPPSSIRMYPQCFL